MKKSNRRSTQYFGIELTPHGVTIFSDGETREACKKSAERKAAALRGGLWNTILKNLIVCSRTEAKSQYRLTDQEIDLYFKNQEFESEITF